MSIPHRGLRHIRTPLDLVNPQRKFFRLAVLSALRDRQTKDIKTARSRIEDLESSLSEIQTETESLLQFVNTAGNAVDCPQDNQPKPERRLNRHGFRLRY